MTHDIHPRMKTVEAAALATNVDRLGGGAALEQLFSRHDPVLPPGQLRDQGIQSTRLLFTVHNTVNDRRVGVRPREARV